jgi:hypothetical protein
LFERSTTSQANRPKTVRALRLSARNVGIIETVVIQTVVSNRSALAEAALRDSWTGELGQGAESPRPSASRANPTT